MAYRKSYNGFKLAGLYQWVWDLDGDFNWYAGVGGGVGSYSFDNNAIDDETFVFAAGDIGIEYNFDIPLQLALDFRPELGFGDYRDDLDFDIALGVRYQILITIIIKHKKATYFRWFFFVLNLIFYIYLRSLDILLRTAEQFDGYQMF